MFSSRRVLLGTFSVVVATVIVGLALAACEKKPATAAPPLSGLPPLGEEPKPTVAGDRPVHEPMGQNPHAMGGNLPPGHPQLGATDKGGKEPAADEPAGTPGDIPFDPKSVISGVLRLDDKVKGKVAAGDVIYLVARSADQPGPPLAVKRLTVGSWPLPFSLDGRDAMMAGTKMSGKVVVNARVDKDGDAMTKNPGDVTGTSRPTQVPADKVLINLDTVL